MRLQLDIRLQRRASSHMAMLCGKDKPGEGKLPHSHNRSASCGGIAANGTDVNESTTNR
jgi:hypothetical protein